MAALFPSVTVILRSALKTTVSESVALLLAEFGSLTPKGAVTLAVLERVPVAVEATFPVALYVTKLPAGIVRVSWMLPVPVAVNPDAPPLCVAVNVTPVKIAGKLSVIVAPLTLLGPAFVTLML